MSDNADKVSFSDACRELQISEEELEKLVANSEISSVKEGDTFFFKPEVIQQFKKGRKTQPTIILSDDELDLLDDVDDISLDDLDDLDLGLDAVAAEAQTDQIDADAAVEAIGASADSASDRLEIDELDLSELSLDAAAPETDTSALTEAAALDAAATLEDEISLDGLDTEPAAAAEDSQDTVLNLDGLMDDEDGSEATTPVPGLDLGGLDTADDITLEGDTILDTEVLDLGDDGDFQLDAGGTDHASTLLRSGGARVMQMKRVKGTPVMTCLLLLTGVLLFIPLAVLVNIYFFDRFYPTSGPSDQQWIQETAGVMRPFLESIADAIGD